MKWICSLIVVACLVCLPDCPKAEAAGRVTVHSTKTVSAKHAQRIAVREARKNARHGVSSPTPASSPASQPAGTVPAKAAAGLPVEAASLNAVEFRIITPQYAEISGNESDVFAAWETYQTYLLPDWRSYLDQEGKSGDMLRREFATAKTQSADGTLMLYIGDPENKAALMETKRRHGS